MRNEKRFVTLVSVIAAAFLAGGKLVVGLLTGSLGLLSEAAHSGLDFIASVVTFFAVRLSDAPADREHTYGHGKVENLSALLEAGLLLVACIWIIYEAVRRIFYHAVPIEVNALAFGVVIASILIDSWRSTALRRAARRYKSQALEADALNFTVDLVTSSVVLVGLCLVKYGEHIGRAEAYQKADAIAALVVTVLLMGVTLRLAGRAVDVLMDRAPRGVQEKVKALARAVDGVLSVHQVRVRPSGNRIFIDLHVCVPRNLGFEPSHRIAEAVESAVKQGVENADVVVHVEPREDPNETLAERVRVVAANCGVPVHEMHFHRQDGRLHLDLHLEVNPHLPLDKAHDISRRLERCLRAEVPEIDHVHTHIEPRPPDSRKTDSVAGPDSDMAERIKEAVRGVRGVTGCHAVEVVRTKRADSGREDLIVSLHCTFAEHTRIDEVHRVASSIEQMLKSKYPAVQRVLVHTEPESRGV